eukprot:CAMPEP_0203694414 /NCGR_PEP_ID=MMETSP0091-20130426/6143_1 /ASSEMBLY_ACC=CAM_ASM_001089 /TAXON_ID=426623 /ORGANISM="Chaetoceros affinis, Strain CCMP159" /LENGTH=506 /DNA_ID=CAMNT_0050565751 /DNA_START=174 /DNA_END=1694 /DNA_ORIENTATION=+
MKQVHHAKMNNWIKVVLVLCCFSAIQISSYFLDIGGEIAGHPSTNNINQSTASAIETPSLSTPREKDSNYYSWIGDHWIPPKGRLVYSASDFLTYFQKRNVLFIGDSTARRSYATLYGLMTADDLEDIEVEGIDHPSILDFNKNNESVQETCEFSDRLFSNTIFASDSEEDKKVLESLAMTFVCRNLPSPSSVAAATVPQRYRGPSLLNTITKDQNLPSVAATTKPPKFDFLRVNCLGHLLHLFTPSPQNNNTFSDYHYQFNSFNTSIETLPTILPYLEDYDLVIVAAGVWNAGGMNKYCGTMTIRGNDENDNSENDNNNPIDHLKAALHALKDASSPNLQIAFRTVGFVDNKKEFDNLWDMLVETKNFFDELNRNDFLSPSKSNSAANMTLVDWGSNIVKKSFGQNRIVGDIKAHYGLGARLLFAQQLLHELLVAEQVDMNDQDEKTNIQPNAEANRNPNNNNKRKHRGDDSDGDKDRKRDRRRKKVARESTNHHRQRGSKRSRS